MIKISPFNRSAAGVYLFIFSSLLIYPFILGIYPATRFVQEQIDIQVYSTHVTVKGRYVYRNSFPFPVAQGLSIPFHIDSDHAPPINIRAIQLTPRKKVIPLRYILGRHRFDLKFMPLEQKEIEISYRQETPMKNARYILRTTKPWKKPLVEGVYRLRLNGARLVYSNYSLLSDGKDVYLFTAKKFMPQKDWDFSWEM